MGSGGQMGMDNLTVDLQTVYCMEIWVTKLDRYVTNVHYC